MTKHTRLVVHTDHGTLRPTNLQHGGQNVPTLQGSDELSVTLGKDYNPVGSLRCCYSLFKCNIDQFFVKHQHQLSCLTLKVEGRFLLLSIRSPVYRLRRLFLSLIQQTQGHARCIHLALKTAPTTMGCTLSGMEDASREKRELETYVTPEDIRLVKESWKIVGQDLDGAGMMVFHKLFEKNRDLKRLFHNVTRQEADGETVLDEEKLRTHSRIVMDGLGAAVESLEDSVILTNILILMGERHAAYQVRPEMVGLLWPAIRDTFKEKLDEDFTPEIARAWTHVFDYLKSRFQEGIRRGRSQRNEM
ncbi:cytoglobin-2-like [Crassostrea virginica]